MTKFVSIFISVASVLILLIGSGVIAQIMLASLQIFPSAPDPGWKERNMIVVLGGGLTSTAPVRSAPRAQSRVREAARLYFDCLKSKKFCRVLASGGDPKNQGVSEAQTMKIELAEMGVNPEDISIEATSTSTAENAQFTKRILQEQSPHRIVIVTSGFHLRRAGLYFSRFTDDLVFAPSDQETVHISIFPTARNFFLTGLALRELLDILRLRVFRS